MRLGCVISMVVMAWWVSAVAARGQTTAGASGDWDRVAAARYLDDRMDMWFEKARSLKTGEGKTTCLSCHMVVPYLLARPALRRAMRVEQPTRQEARLLEEMGRRVGTYPDHESLSDASHGGERGTEAVLNVLILARQDAAQQRQEPSDLSREAIRQLWETQRADGGWDWMNFGQEPDESADSQYYGAALAAMAVGTVPGVPGGGQAAASGYVHKLRSYLRGNYAGQNLYNRTWMLLASAKLAGLLDREQRERVIGELLAAQNSDGGWSLSKLGRWRWSRTGPPYAPPGKTEASLLEQSDGYATGLIVYTLRQAGRPASDASVGKGIRWLKANQKEIEVEGKVWKCWRTHSLNHDREHGGGRGGAWNRLLMSDTATAYAVLALTGQE